MAMMLKDANPLAYADKVAAFLCGEPVTVRLIVALRGVTVKAALNLKDGLDLVPSDQVPEHYWYAPRVWMEPRGEDFTRPTAALIATYSYAPVFKSSVSLKPCSDPAYLRALADIRDAMTALALLEGCAPVEIGQWTKHSTPFAQESFHSTPSITPKDNGFEVQHVWTLTIPEVWAVHGSGPSTTFARQAFDARTPDADTVIEAATLCFGAPSQVKMALEVAVARLVKAKWTTDLVDRAIELGICLESLLARGPENTEITFRLRLWGATILGKTTDERVHISKQLQDLYALRSSAVHQGTLSRKVRNPEDLLKAGIRLAERIIRALLRQEWPMTLSLERVWTADAEGTENGPQSPNLSGNVGIEP